MAELLTVFAPNRPPIALASGSLRWSVIKRGDKYGIRARDLESLVVKVFHGVKRYLVDERWRVKARRLIRPALLHPTLPVLYRQGRTG